MRAVDEGGENDLLLCFDECLRLLLLLLLLLRLTLLAN